MSVKGDQSGRGFRRQRSESWRGGIVAVEEENLGKLVDAEKVGVVCSRDHHQVTWQLNMCMCRTRGRNFQPGGGCL